MKKTLKISIILPTYNGAELIQKAISSVLTQSFLDYELIIINDGSTDNTEEIVNNFVKKDSRIKYIKNEQNLGIQRTLNRGLKEAKGEYIARIDDDDQWIDKNKLKKQFEFLDKNPEYVLIGTGAVIFNERGFELTRYLMPNSDKEIRNKILSKNCFLHSSVFFNKEKALQFGGYDESTQAKHIEDYDLWLKMGMIGKFANLNIYMVSLRQDKGTISAENRITQAKRSFLEIKKYKNKYPKFVKGYLFGVIRISFAYIQRIISLEGAFLYKIKAIYKKF